MKANSRHSSRGLNLIKALLFVCAVILVGSIFAGSLGRVTAIVTMPIFSVRHWLAESTAVLPSYVRSRKELINELDALRDQVSAQGGKDATIVRLSAENDELRALLSATHEERIAASVLARPPYLPYDAILIDQGERDGVLEGAIVYHSHDQAIGFIAKVFSSSALVALFSTSGMQATVYVIGPDIYTPMYGEGGGVMRIEVPQGITMHEGDVVILPSVDSGILGTITEIESSPTQPVQKGFVLSDTPLQSLNLVSVSKYVVDSVTYEAAERIIKNVTSNRFIIDLPEGELHDAVMSTTSTGTREAADNLSG